MDHMRRRTFLARSAAGVTGAALVGLGVQSAVSNPGRPPDIPDSVEERVLLQGTPHETSIYVRETGSGPTVVVIGGLHGDEVAGFRTAEQVAHWEIEGGNLVVLPRANRIAIERGERHGTDGDLNRQFPPGEEPGTALARAIWALVERHDPALVLDLHESQGIYRLHAGLVGQVLFPTAHGNAPAHADEVVTTLNREVVPWHMPFHDYKRGNVLRGTAPLLIHKVAADLGRPGYIVETTDFLLDIDERIRWEARATAELLTRHGFVPRGPSIPDEVINR